MGSIGGSVYLVWHDHGPPEDTDNAKLLGVFSTRPLAEERVRRAKSQRGFADHPDGFVIDEYVVDHDEWRDGFVEIDSDRWGAEGWGATIPSVVDIAEEP